MLMTRLRPRMLEDMQLRGLALRTQEAYLSAVQQLALHYGKSPDLITEDELRQYFLFLCNQKRLAPNTTNVALNGIKFLYTHTLHRPWPLRDLIRPPIPKKLPIVLAPEEVWRIVEQVRRPDYRVCLSVISACGLRLLEGVRLQVSQIDSARMQLHIRSGKGNQDRAIRLPPKTLTLLRAHWLTHRNRTWLFPSPGVRGDQRRTAGTPMAESGVQKAFRRAVQEVGLTKPASV